jgi:tripartite-type tricarboxylate transporter receptor subunit TctC
MPVPTAPDGPGTNQETSMKVIAYWFSLGLTLSTAAACLPVRAAEAVIKLVVPFGAGTSVDSTARPFSRALAEAAKQPVIVENRAGAEGWIGAKAVMDAPPDGLTLMFTSNSVPAVLPALRKVAAVDPAADFVPVCAISRAPMNVFIRSSLPFKTVGELVAAARAHPGKYTFAYSTGLNRLGAEWFQQLADIKLRGIAYKATGQALVDILAGAVDLIVADTSTALTHYQNGRLRPLVVAQDQRSAAMPEVPAAPETGLAAFSVNVWFAVYLPSRTPEAIAGRLTQLVKTAAASSAVREANQAGGREPMVLCGDDLGRYQKAETAHWRHVIDKAGISIE